MRTLFVVEVEITHDTPLSEDNHIHITGNLQHSISTSGICVGKSLSIKKIEPRKSITTFDKLTAGQRFGLIDGSDVDGPFEKTGRVFIKTNSWWPIDEKGQVWDYFSNATCIIDPGTKTNPFIIEPTEEVIVFEDK